MRMSEPGAQPCNGYEAPMEEYLEALAEDSSARPAAELGRHLAECAACRESLDEMQAVSAILRESAVRVPESLASDPYFAVRAGARARASVRRGAEFWPQLEAFSMRFMAAAISAALMLGAMAAWGSQRRVPQNMARLRPADYRFLSPETNPAPGSADEVVTALLTRSAQPASAGGRQQ